ncbi:hypothetical protein GF367_00085 [Candidatus Woesearchaeota archaeon]|nr:hypothetical protein [Candidatus Woesearchaeota archaeon]
MRRESTNDPSTDWSIITIMLEIGIFMLKYGYTAKQMTRGRAAQTAISTRRIHL